MSSPGVADPATLRRVLADITASRYWPYGGYFTTKGVERFILGLADHAQPGQRILDLGCGRAAPYRAYHEALGLTWHGADVFPATDPPHPRYQPVVNNVIPFGDATFDIVACYHVIEHFDHPEAMFAEIARVTRPGGLFCGAFAFWEREHESFFHLTHRGVQAILRRHRFTVLSVTSSDFSGVVLAGQRWFGGEGRIEGKGLDLMKVLIAGTLSLAPFLAFSFFELLRRTLFRRFYNPLRDAATLYVYARRND